MNPDPQEQFSRKLAQRLTQLQAVPPREPGAAATGRAAYLAQAEAAAAQIRAQAVSAPPKQRHSWWIAWIRKERKPAMSTLITIIVILAVALGGTGATVAAAQEALPGEALYGVKIASEDFRLSITPDPQAKLALALELTQERLEEILALHAGGQAIPDEAPLRLETQLQTVLQLAATLEEAEVPSALTAIQVRLRDQDQLMSMLGSKVSENAALLRARQAIRQELDLVQQGLEDPLEFQLRFRFGQPEETTEPGNPPDPAVTEAPGAGPGPHNTAAPGAGPGPAVTDAPGAGPGPLATEGAGPGPGPVVTAAPGVGPGPQASEAPGSGPGPVVTQAPQTGPGPQPTVTPGSGSGGSGNGQSGKP